jgi:hypothetical protein
VKLLGWLKADRGHDLVKHFWRSKFISQKEKKKKKKKEKKKLVINPLLR